MNITWSHRGRDSLKGVIAYAAKEDVAFARTLRDRVIEKIALLQETPYLGLSYEMQTRRLPLGDFPYTIYYRIESQEIQILQIRHIKQLPPVDLN